MTMIQRYSLASCPHLKPFSNLQDHPRKPELIVQHLKSENTDADDRQPYEQSKQIHQQNGKDGIQQSASSQAVQHNISMTMLLANQNEELALKVDILKRQIMDQQLKANIFADKIHKNHQEIARLTHHKQQLIDSQTNSLRMQTLDESHIPNKQPDTSATLHNNSNSWMNEFLNKQELQSLWNTKRLAKSSQPLKVQPKLKCFTIDLSSHMRQKKEKERAQCKLSCSSANPKDIKMRSEKADKNEKAIDKTKKTIVSLVHNAKSLSGRLDLRLNLQHKSVVAHEAADKTKALNKAICTLRNAKKLKPNPQL